MNDEQAIFRGEIDEQTALEWMKLIKEAGDVLGPEEVKEIETFQKAFNIGFNRAVIWILQKIQKERDELIRTNNLNLEFIKIWLDFPGRSCSELEWNRWMLRIDGLRKKIRS
jgi:hypothetical protein